MHCKKPYVLISLPQMIAKKPWDITWMHKIVESRLSMHDIISHWEISLAEYSLMDCTVHWVKSHYPPGNHHASHF